MIIGFVVYRCHGNIDFLKLSTTTNFSLYAQQVKMSFKNVRYSAQKNCMGGGAPDI